MNRTYINRKANKLCKAQCVEHGVFICEKCGGNFILTFAHRHKRSWYYGREELLWHWTQFLLLCIRCHDEIEYERAYSDELFQQKRGDEYVVPISNGLF